ncbi:uncharacterized protein F54H12.2 [Trichonephila clavipes]|nr:uncharacterized protein F54H12.2 [Trichonephila clavipes]
MPFTRIEVKTFTVSSDLKSVIIPNGVNGVLPSRIILGLISNSAFNFKHYNLNHIAPSDNGIQIPTTAYTPDYAKDLYARNYLSLFTDLAQHKTNVSYDDYKKNISLYVFDLAQDKSASEPFGNMMRSGDILIHLKFDAELLETVTLIAYMEMPSLIEIDKS